MKKVIITGATGFIGFNVFKELYAKGVEIIAVVRKNSKNIDKLKGYNVRIVECLLENVEDLVDLIPDRDIDIIYHFAWQGVSDLDLQNESVQICNLESTLKIIDIGKTMNIKSFIGAGSLHEAEAIEEMGIDKTISNLGFMYKSCKLAAHYMAKAKAGAYGIKFFWPVVTNAYGEGENSGRLINTIIKKIMNDDEPALSEGHQLYDFIHIKDVSRAFVLIGEKGIDGSNYIIGSGYPKKLKDYLKIVGDITNKHKGGKEIQLGFGKIKSNVVYLKKDAFDSTKLKKDTGFVPTITFEEGIDRTVKWLMENVI